IAAGDCEIDRAAEVQGGESRGGLGGDGPGGLDKGGRSDAGRSARGQGIGVDAVIEGANKSAVVDPGVAAAAEKTALIEVAGSRAEEIDLVADAVDSAGDDVVHRG